MKDNRGVGRVVLVVVGAPATGNEMDFDRATKVVAACIQDGAGEIRAKRATGHTGKDDLQAATAFEPERASKAVRPAGGEGGFGRGIGRPTRNHGEGCGSGWSPEVAS